MLQACVLTHMPYFSSLLLSLLTISIPVDEALYLGNRPARLACLILPL